MAKKYFFRRSRRLRGSLYKPGDALPGFVDAHAVIGLEAQGFIESREVSGKTDLEKKVVSARETEAKANEGDSAGADKADSGEALESEPEWLSTLKSVNVASYMKLRSAIAASKWPGVNAAGGHSELKEKRERILREYRSSNG